MDNVDKQTPANESELQQQELPNISAVTEQPVTAGEDSQIVSDQVSTPEPVEEQSFLVENHRQILKNWGDIDIGMAMSEPTIAASRADFQAAQIVSGSDLTEAGKALVADLMQYEHYRGAFKVSAENYYADMPDKYKPTLEEGLAIANGLVKEAEARYGVAKTHDEPVHTSEELEALRVKYGSRVDLEEMPDLTPKGEPMVVEVFDQKFGSLGMFQGKLEDAFDHALVKVDQKERELAAEKKAADTQDLEPAAAIAPPLTLVQPTEVQEAKSPALAEVPVMPIRPAAETTISTSDTAESAVDSIWVGPPRPRGEEVQPQVSLIDKDALLTRLTNELQSDKTVLYKLDGEPAFIDRGMRLEMVDGASQNEEKVLAALLTAAEYYRGRIELTGSDAFQRKAIELIALHQLNVTMKNPGQQAQLVEARKALQVEPAVKDSINGESPPAYGSPSQPSADPVSTPVGDSPAADPAAVQTPAATGPVADTGEIPQTGALQAVEKAVPKARLPVPSASDEDQSSPKNGSTTKISPAIHQNFQAAANGVTGKVIECGDAPFRFDESNKSSTYIKLRTRAGTETYWGKELAGLLRSTRIQPGKVVTLQWLGKEAVVVQAPVRDDKGTITHYEPKDAHRNQWSLTVMGGETVRTGQDEGVKLAAYDVQRFGQIQQVLMERLRMDIPLPSSPKDALYWLTPDGQGSFKTGDALTAPRPGEDRSAAGQPVISSWSKDGHLEMALVRGDGPYLQGVVLQGGQFQHVLVSLPGRDDAPPMVFNALTPEGLVPIGVGNAINRSGGEPVSRENIAFKLEGDSTARLGKLDKPAEIPPALHARLGFDERWKDDNTLPKSAPAAAPTVQPSEPRPA